MGFKLYSKLALDNIKKNKSTYFPYIFSSLVIISLFFILVSMKASTGNINFLGSRTIDMVLDLGMNVTSLFSLVFLFYTNSFLMKRRQKELGLYSVLGMEKKHIIKVVSLEIIYSGFLSLILAVFFGLIFSKLIFAALLNILQLDTSIHFILSLDPIIKTILTYSLIFLLIIVYNAFRIWKMNPLDLIATKEKGEQEPKANLFLGLLGLVSLIVGYTLSLSIKNPILALPTLFIAILLVSIGTYFLFTSASILLLKFLRTRRKFYYQKKNFIIISSMIYRMKQNAVGLANITILSTAVLLVLSTTFSLYTGMEDILASDYPKDVITSYRADPELLSDIDDTINKHASNHNLGISNPIKFNNLTVPIYIEKNILTSANMVEKENITKMKNLELYTLEDYNQIYSEEMYLDNKEIAVYSDTVDLDYESLNIMGEEYFVKEKLNNEIFYPEEGFPGVTVVVSDFENLEKLQTQSEILLNEDESFYGSRILREYYFDIEGTEQAKLNFGETLWQTLRDKREEAGEVRDVYTAKDLYLSQYGTLFFVGIFLGILFLVATVLIIYYKQISEGYQDQERYKVLQKVGMTKDEVKATIHTQIKFVFFLPIAVATTHILFAFPLLKKVLGMMGLFNTNLFILVTFISIIVFAIFYAIVYNQTAKIYYKIVN